jgi:hypothetical protein
MWALQKHTAVNGRKNSEGACAYGGQALGEHFKYRAIYINF